MLNKLIKIRRGLKANIPSTLANGEPVWTTDTKEMYVGDGSGSYNPVCKCGGDGGLYHFCCHGRLYSDEGQSWSETCVDHYFRIPVQLPPHYTGFNMPLSTVTIRQCRVTRKSTGVILVGDEPTDDTVADLISERPWGSELVLRFCYKTTDIIPWNEPLVLDYSVEVLLRDDC